MTSSTVDPIRRDIYWCNACSALKPRDAFWTAKNRPSGLQAFCKPCHARRKALGRSSTTPAVRRSRNLRYRFGITDEHFSLLLAAQQGKCAICDATECLPKSGKRQLAIDHDHNTGQIRGLLCTRCNVGLGMFRDELALVERAVAYLSKHST